MCIIIIILLPEIKIQNPCIPHISLHSIIPITAITDYRHLIHNLNCEIYILMCETSIAGWLAEGRQISATWLAISLNCDLATAKDEMYFPTSLILCST